jgi:DNA polymerase-3 subunit delta'
MNWDMMGHEWAVQLLKGHIERDRVRHAYLFCGPMGVGRRTLALRLAQALNCPQPTAPGQPCRTCRTCTQIERMQHPDLSIVQAETQGGVLKVDQIRELGRGLGLAPYEGRYKVAILLRFEEANDNASNALLKTLEEPAPKVVLVITAESVESLLPTIVSRCEVLRLRPLPVDQVSRGLQTNWDLPLDQAQLLAHISGGRPGYALALHREPDRMALRDEWLDEHAVLLESNRVQRFEFAEKLAKKREVLHLELSVWLSLWRDVLLQVAGASVPLVNPDRGEEIKNLAAAYDLNVAQGTVSTIERTMDLIDHNVNPRLALEVLMLDLPRAV